MRRRAFLGALTGATAASETAPSWDLGSAAILTEPQAGEREAGAAQLLAGEIAQRTGIELPVLRDWPRGARPVIALTRAAGKAEGYRLRSFERSGQHVVEVAGHDERGVLFAAGALLRALEMDRGRIRLDAPLEASSAPVYGLRGHQMGYRPKANSYDGWTFPMWEQYIRDLAVFGTNAVELLPPRTDDAPDSPHFPLPQMEMMIRMSRLLDQLGLDVWVWYPAMGRGYDAAMLEEAEKEWADVLGRLPRVDAIHVPGGDPGENRPAILFRVLERQIRLARRYHPKATIWLAPSRFPPDWWSEFFALVNKQPDWLGGVVYAPFARIAIADLRAKLPPRYPIRLYPDITHARLCAYPVPDWDLAYAVTLGREPINPRPVDMERLFRHLAPHAIGSIAYSEGCNDDVNKIVWSSLGWDPTKNVTAILREYARYFFGPACEEDLAQGLQNLERNWRGPLLTNDGVDRTLEQFQALERRATPRNKLSWRFQQALYRTYYDAYTRSRLLYETALERRALDRLREAPVVGALTAVRAAEKTVDLAATAPPAPALRARVFELAEALFQSARMQLSVPLYQASGVMRGANLDCIDLPLNNRFWLKARFEELRKLASEPERLAAIAAILDRSNPGPGGFHDELGNPMGRPHVPERPPYGQDPGFIVTPATGFSVPDSFQAPQLAYPISWWRHLETMNDTPLTLRYKDLNPALAYAVRVVYAGNTVEPKIRLEANGIEVHGWLDRPVPFRPLEFDLPRAATASGALELTWRMESTLHGTGRGLQIAEVMVFPRPSR